MRSNAEFGKFLFDLRPQTRPAWLALYNYLRNFCRMQVPFTPDTIFKFYLTALNFEHWQKNVLELTQDTKFLLERFLGDEQGTEAWKNLVHACDIQILKIKNKNDQLEVIGRHLNSKILAMPNTQAQIFADQKQMVHAVMLFPKKCIHVLTFNDMVYIHHGQLFPLLQNQKLEYEDNLELAHNCKQTITVSPFMTAQFSLQNGAITGEWIRGYTFQNYRKIDIHELHQEPQLLYAIKRLERFFIDRTSEPLYTELIGALEQTIDFLRKDMEGSLELARKSFLRGKNALENIFIDDKMLELLLKEINSLLIDKGQGPWQQTPYASTNTYLKQEFAQDEEQIV